MKIELITVWYNEEFLAPFFLNHYSWVDKIHILLDADTNDRTEEIARSYQNVTIDYIKFPDMLDDIIKSRKINEKYKSIVEADYVIVVDSDEFISCNLLENSVHDHIMAKGKSLYFATLWQIYQHEHDGALDYSKPVILQRRHGDPVIEHCYIKPVIAKSGLDIVWGYGNHSVVLNGVFMAWNTRNAQMMNKLQVAVYPADMVQGAHWKLFDLDETIKRRIQNRTNRQSQFNLKLQFAYHYYKTQVDDIVKEFNNMKQLPVVIKDRVCQSQAICLESIFENVLAEESFSESYAENTYANGIGQLFASTELPDWYQDVQPQTTSESLAEEMFLLAFEYYRNGNRDQAIKVLQKATRLSPDSVHYSFYLQNWLNK